MGCHKTIATPITAQGGDYLLALKGNHPALYADGGRLFGDEKSLARQKPTRARKPWKRTTGAPKRAAAVALDAATLLGNLRGLAAWSGVAECGHMVEARRQACLPAALSGQRGAALLPGEQPARRGQPSFTGRTGPLGHLENNLAPDARRPL